MKIKFEEHKGQNDFLSFEYDQEWGNLHISAEVPDGTVLGDIDFIGHTLYGDRIQKLYDFLGKVLEKKNKNEEFKEFQKAVDWFGRGMNSDGLTLGVGKGYAVKDKNDRTIDDGPSPSHAILNAYRREN